MKPKERQLARPPFLLLFGLTVCFLAPAINGDAFDIAASKVQLRCEPYPYCAWRQLRKYFAPSAGNVRPIEAKIAPETMKTTTQVTPKKCTKCACGYEYPDTLANFRALLKNKKKKSSIQNREQHYYYPWIVRLMKVTEVTTQTISASTICAGTLMNKQYILTAASCVYEWQNMHSKIMVSIGGGKMNARMEANDDGPQYFAINMITIHPQYKPATSDNNVALIQLKSPLKDPKYVPICLPSKKARSSIPMKSMTLSWGKRKPSIGHLGKISPMDLIVDNSQLISANQCKELSKNYYANITDNMVCSEQQYPSTVSSCHSESGGPLVIKGTNGRYGIHGVATWTNGCGAFGTPGVYADVLKYVGWMKQEMKTNCVTCL